MPAEVRWRTRIAGGALAALLLAAGSPGAEAPAFFPQGTFDEFRTGWYTEELAALGERPIFGDTAAPATLRFTWLRSFHHPLIVRVEFRDDGTARLFLKVGGGQGGRDPGATIVDRGRGLGPRETASLREGIDAVRRCPTPPPPPKPVNGVLVVNSDGAEWVFELREGARYCALVVWSPDDGPFRELGLGLVRLARLWIPRGQIY